MEQITSSYNNGENFINNNFEYYEDKVNLDELFDKQIRHDDLRIIDKYIEYDKKSKNNEVAYFTYLLAKNEDEGEWSYWVKVVKLCKVTNIPKELREKKALMVSQDELLSAIWHKQLNFITLYANLTDKKQLGLMFCYGVQETEVVQEYTDYYDQSYSNEEKISLILKKLKKQADANYGGLIRLLRGNFRQAQFKPLNMEEAEEIRDCIESAKNLQVIRGIPKTHISSASGVTTSMTGITTTPDGIEQDEEFIRAMLHDYYANIIMAFPVAQQNLLEWSTNIARELSMYKSQYSGMISHTAGISIPMVFANNSSINTGSSEGISDSASHNVGVSNGISDNYSHNVGENHGLSHNLGYNQGQNIGLADSISQSQTNSNSYGLSDSQSLAKTIGTSNTESVGTTDGITESQGIAKSHTVGTSESFSESKSVSDSLSHSVGQSYSEGKTHGITNGITNTQSVGTTDTNTISHGTTVGTTNTQGNTHTISNGTTDTTTQSQGTSSTSSQGFNNSTSQGFNNSTSHGTTNTTTHGESNGTSHTISNGTSDTQGTTITDSTSKGSTSGQGANWGTSTNTGGNAGANVGFASGGINYGTGENTGGNASWTDSSSNSHSTGNSQSHSNTHSVSDGTTHTTTDSVSQGISNSVSQGTSNSISQGTSNSISQGISNSIGNSHGISNSMSDSVSNSVSKSLSNSLTNAISHGVSHSNSLANSHSISDSISQTNGLSQSVSAGKTYSQGVGHSVGTTISDGVTESNSVSKSHAKSHTMSTGTTQSVSNGHSVGTTQTASNGISNGLGRTASQGISQGLSDAQGVSKGVSIGDSRGQGVSKGTSEGVGTSQGTTSAQTHALGTGQGLNFSFGPSVGYSRSYQVFDEDKGNLIKILEEQNNRMNLACRMGAFYVDAYVVSHTDEAKRGIGLAARTSWGGDTNLGTAQVIDTDPVTSEHLLKHASVFEPCTMKENTRNIIDGYLWSTLLLTSELAALTHLPRVETGGASTVATNIPPFSVMAGKKGEIYFGKQINFEDGEAFYDYSFSKKEFMHTLICGASGCGKTTSAVRIAREVINKYEDMKIFALDWKNSWRVLKRFAKNDDDFDFYSLDYSGIRPINMNVYVPPKYVNIIQWRNKVHESLCIGYGLGNKMLAVLNQATQYLFLKKGVLLKDENNIPYEAPDARDKIYDVTLADIYEVIGQMKEGTGDFKQAGRGMQDAYDSILAKLEPYYSGELRPLYCCKDKEKCVLVNELIDGRRIMVLEGGDLDEQSKKFIISLISWGVFMYSRLRKNRERFVEKRFFILEEAHRIIASDDAGSSNPLQISEDIFQIIFNEAREYGIYAMPIVQTPSHLPSNVVTNCSILIVHRLGNKEDIDLMTLSLVRNGRLDNRDVPLWLAKESTGQAVVRINNTSSHPESEPVLIQVARCDAEPPDDIELICSLDLPTPPYLKEQIKKDPYLSYEEIEANLIDEFDTYKDHEI